MTKKRTKYTEIQIQGDTVQKKSKTTTTNSIPKYYFHPNTLTPILLTDEQIKKNFDGVVKTRWSNSILVNKTNSKIPISHTLSIEEVSSSIGSTIVIKNPKPPRKYTPYDGEVKRPARSKMWKAYRQQNKIFDEKLSIDDGLSNNNKQSPTTNSSTNNSPSISSMLANYHATAFHPTDLQTTNASTRKTPSQFPFNTDITLAFKPAVLSLTPPENNTPENSPPASP